MICLNFASMADVSSRPKVEARCGARKRLDLRAHQVLQLRRRDDGHGRPPCHQVIDDLLRPPA